MLLDFSILLLFLLQHMVIISSRILISAEVWNNHKRQIYSIFFKRWVAIPRRLPTMPLIDEIFGPDPLKIAERQPRTRTIIAMYYSNGCHHRLCVNGNCFSFNRGRLPCQCIFCLDEISDNGDVFCCPALHGVIILERLKIWLMAIAYQKSMRTRNEVIRY